MNDEHTARLICDYCGHEEHKPFNNGDKCPVCDDGIFKDIEKSNTILVDYDHNLDIRDLAILAEEIAHLDSREDELELKRKKVAAEWASDIKKVITSRKVKSKIYRDKKEIRTAECIYRPNYSEGKMEFVEIGTFKIISSRPLTNEERQLKVFDHQDEKDHDDDTDESNEENPPRCHMKDMVLKNSDSGEMFFECSVCKSKKYIENA